MIRREVVEPRVSAVFYWEVIQEVLRFGVETWILLKVMYQKLEGVKVYH